MAFHSLLIFKDCHQPWLIFFFIRRSPLLMLIYEHFFHIDDFVNLCTEYWLISDLYSRIIIKAPPSPCIDTIYFMVMRCVLTRAASSIFLQSTQDSLQGLSGIDVKSIFQKEQEDTHKINFIKLPKF